MNVQVKLNQYPFPPGWTPNLEITRVDFYSLQISGPPAEQLKLGFEVFPQFSRREITRKTHMTESEIPPPPLEALVANLSATTMEAPPQDIPVSHRRLLQEESHRSGPLLVRSMPQQPSGWGRGHWDQEKVRRRELSPSDFPWGRGNPFHSEGGVTGRLQPSRVGDSTEGNCHQC